VRVQLPSSAGLSPEEMAAVVIAVTTLSGRGAPAPPPEVLTPPWRFSGRWFSASRRRV